MGCRPGPEINAQILEFRAGDRKTGPVRDGFRRDLRHMACCRISGEQIRDGLSFRSNAIAEPAAHLHDMIQEGFPEISQVRPDTGPPMDPVHDFFGQIHTVRIGPACLLSVRLPGGPQTGRGQGKKYHFIFGKGHGSRQFAQSTAAISGSKLRIASGQIFHRVAGPDSLQCQAGETAEPGSCPSAQARFPAVTVDTGVFRRQDQMRIGGQQASSDIDFPALQDQASAAPAGNLQIPGGQFPTQPGQIRHQSSPADIELVGDLVRDHGPFCPEQRLKKVFHPVLGQSLPFPGSHTADETVQTGRICHFQTADSLLSADGSDSGQIFFQSGQVIADGPLSH